MKKIMQIPVERILHVLLSLTVLIDFCNGIMPSIPFGEICRLTLIFVCGICLVKYNRRKAWMALLTVVFLSVNAFVSFLGHRSLPGLIYDAGMLLKVSLCAILLFTLTTLFDEKIMTADSFRMILINNLVYTPGLFIITMILGIGQASYAWSNVGFKSVFLSLNSFNVALFVMYIYAVYKAFRSDTKGVKWLCAVVYTAFPMLALGTKAGLLVTGAILVWFAIRSMNTRKGRKRVCIICAILAIAVVICWPFVGAKFMDILRRQITLFSQRDIFSYLFSGRNWMLDMAVDYYRETATVVNTLFGQGYYYSHHQLAELSNYLSTAAVRPIEMDWADLLIAYGPVGLLVTYGPVLSVLLRNLKKCLHGEVEPYYLSSLVVLGFGTLAGHVFVEAISATYLAISVAGVYIFANDTAHSLKKLQ